MVSANTAIGLVSYKIKALGQRVQKITPTKKAASIVAANVIARAQGRNQPDPSDDECDRQEKLDEQKCSPMSPGGARRACYAQAAIDAAKCRERNACKK